MALALHTGSSRSCVERCAALCKNCPLGERNHGLATEQAATQTDQKKSDRTYNFPASKRRQKRGRRNCESRNQRTAGGTASDDTARGSLRLAEIPYAGVGRTARSGRPGYPDPE